MILLTGANGQLGAEIRHLLDELKINYIRYLLSMI